MVSLFISITGTPLSFKVSTKVWIAATLASYLWLNLSFSCCIKVSFSIKSGSGEFHISSFSSGVNSTTISSSTGFFIFSGAGSPSAPSSAFCSSPSACSFLASSWACSSSYCAFNSSYFSCFFCLINSSSLCFLLACDSLYILSYLTSISSKSNVLSIILFKVTLSTIITLGTRLESLNKSIKGVVIFSSKPFQEASYIVGLNGLNKLLNIALSLSTAL